MVPSEDRGRRVSMAAFEESRSLVFPGDKGWSPFGQRTGVSEKDYEFPPSLTGIRRDVFRACKRVGEGVSSFLLKGRSRRETGGIPADELEQKKLLLSRTAQFWWRSVSIYASYKVCQARMSLVKDRGEHERGWEAQHEEAAEKLHLMCTDLGGFFLKAGQFLAKPDLVPAAWVRRLSVLNDAAPATPFHLVRRTVEAELGRPLNAVFATFDESPIGCASVAQVHRARLKRGGADVAVKVQHPGCEPLMLQDLRNLSQFAALLQKYDFPFDIVSVISELESQIKYEFDFQREARSMDRIARSLAGGVKGGSASPVIVPRSVKDLVTRKMLVMDFIEGVPIMLLGEEMTKRGINPNGTVARLAKRNILRDLTEAYGHMLIKDGFFQADPHPGNILICKGGKVALLDYGQVKEIPEDLRKKFAKLMLALHAGNGLHVGQCMRDMGIVTDKSPEEDPENSGRMGMMMFDTKFPSGMSTSNPFAEESLLKDNVVHTFPKDLFFILRTTLLLRGLSVAMDVDWTVTDRWKKFAEEALATAPAVPTKKPKGRWGRG